MALQGDIPKWSNISTDGETYNSTDSAAADSCSCVLHISQG